MVIKKLKSSYFKQTFYLLKNNKDNALLIFIFDIWFIATILLSSKLAEFSGRAIFRQPLDLYSTAPLIAFVVIYYLIIILIYSFFKYIVLHYLKRMFDNIKLNFKRFGSFFILNLIIMVGLFVVFFALNGAILMNVKKEIAPYIFLLINIPFAFFSYAIINIAHASFINMIKSKEILIKTIKIAFTNAKSCSGIYLSTIIILVAYFFIVYLIGSALKNTQSYLSYYFSYIKLFTIITGIVFYLIIYFNRAYFYLIIKEKFLKNIK